MGGDLCTFGGRLAKRYDQAGQDMGGHEPPRPFGNIFYAHHMLIPQDRRPYTDVQTPGIFFGDYKALSPGGNGTPAFTVRGGWWNGRGEAGCRARQNDCTAFEEKA
jgi:hypothetical protein